MTRTVIVGASLAGIRTAEALRAKGFTGELVLIGDEPHQPYDRPPLSKTVLTGWLTTDHVDLPYASDLGAEWLLGTPAAGLDLATREVVLADQRRVGFDRAVLATGARARPWPFADQATLTGVHLLRGRDDADRLRASLVAGPRRVLVIGGGFAGSEVASSCHDLGLDVTVVTRGAAPMQSALGPIVAGAIGRLQRAAGIDLRPWSTVLALEGDDSGRLRRAALSDGSVLDVDVAVVTTGSLRNVEWLAGSGLAVDGLGVQCDAACRVLDETGAVTANVFAAGDVSRWSHPLFGGEPMTFEHWGNAVDQAKTVAHNIVCAPGDERLNTAPPAFWSDQFGLNIESVGLPSIADEVALAQGSYDSARFVAVYGRAEQTVGAVAVGSPRVLDGCAALIEAKAAFPPMLNAELLRPEPVAS